MSNQTDYETLGASVPTWIARAFRALAYNRSTAEQRVSISEVIRVALVEYVDRHPEDFAEFREADTTPCSESAQ